MDLDGKRVVITTKGKLTYCGEVIQSMKVRERDGYLIMTDSICEICIWCPKDEIERVVVVPIERSKDEK